MNAKENNALEGEINIIEEEVETSENFNDPCFVALHIGTFYLI